MIKILIADDHPIVRHGLKQILAQESQMKVAGEARNGQEALALLRQQHWDVVVLDMSMPKTSGIEVLNELKNKWPKLPVLVLSMHSEEQYAMRVFRAGAAGYITKDSAAKDLVRAIEKVVTGGKYVSPSLAEKLADALQEEETPLHQRLSDREFQVLQKIASGKTVGEIADDLLLSAKTVSTYRARLLKKMKMKTNAELMRHVLENRLSDKI